MHTWIFWGATKGQVNLPLPSCARNQKRITKDLITQKIQLQFNDTGFVLTRVRRDLNSEKFKPSCDPNSGKSHPRQGRKKSTRKASRSQVPLENVNRHPVSDVSNRI
jgi:hypothetical protein